VKYIGVIICVLAVSSGRAQEIGYLSGASKMGISPARFQPLYGFTIGAKLNKFFAFETALFYSQRSIGETIQADYFSFVAFPKIGLFREKFAVYYAPGIALNPTLHHSNIENHTYVSHIQSIGGHVNLKPKIMVDLKLGYDIGLSGAYFENGTYRKYSGPIILLGLKFRVSPD
jgi:hypothetical protein